MGGGPGGKAEAPQQRGHHIVGVAFDVDGQFQQFLFAQGLSGQGIGADQAGHNRRGTAAQAPGWGHRQVHPGLQGHGGGTNLTPYPLGGPINQVFWAATQVGTLAAFDDQLKAFAAAFQHLQPKPVAEVQGGPKAIKTWPEICSGGGYIHQHRLAHGGLNHHCSCTPFQKATRPWICFAACLGSG